jgi:hypothetical protein
MSSRSTKHRGRSRLPNPRLVKINRPYTIEEAARTCRVHRNTVRNWIKAGLPVSDDHKPALIRGRDLFAFLQNRRVKNKRPCGPGRLYCFRCRAPKTPAGDMLDYVPATATSGNLVALCADCNTLMFRSVRRTAIDQVRGNVSVTLQEAQRRIDESG